MVKVLVGFVFGAGICYMAMTHTAEVKSTAKSAVDSAAKSSTQAINKGASAAKEQLSK